MAQSRTERDGHHGEGTVKDKCAHHFEIAKANGPMSPGKCKLCGEKRMFKNYVDEPLKPSTTLN